MKNFYKIMVQGVVGRNPEMRNVPSGQAVTNFSVAVNDDYKNKEGEVVKQAIWFKAVAWGKIAEIANQYLSKGSKVLLVGKLVVDPETLGPKIWQDKDGNSRSSFEINVGELYMLGGGEKKESGSILDTPPLVENDDELPF